MAGCKFVLLTGATGLLGRYLFRDLACSGAALAILARDDSTDSASERIAAIQAFWEESLGVRLPQPVVVCGDLRDSGLGFEAGDRAWLSRRCRAIVHAAANVSFRWNDDGEPWRTNASGTRRLLSLAVGLGIPEFHHVSTAFVCGNRPGPILEEDLNRGQQFHNAYEESKHEAERCVRAARLRATVYRPSVIVGDSQSGYTSAYHGFYRFLDAACRLARPVRATPGDRLRRRIPLRLTLTGREPRNLVPVDWVSSAVASIIGRPEAGGRTYHLIARRPTLVAEIKAAAEEVLGLEGIELTGRALVAPTSLENAFLGAVRDYWPYLDGDPDFDDRNTRSAIPDLPAPNVDRELLCRLIGFAAADGWGRRQSTQTTRPWVDCEDYIERYFPAAAEQSFLVHLPLNVTLGFEVRGPGGGKWVCRVNNGRVSEVTRRASEFSDVIYRTDVETFASVVGARQTPQAAFFERRIEIVGSVEKGLKLAALFAQFVREHPYAPFREEHHAIANSR